MTAKHPRVCLLLVLLVGCGGKLDDESDANSGLQPDSSVDSGHDASADSPLPPPPTCTPDGSKCSSSSACCSSYCDPQMGVCTLPPPACKPDGALCKSPTDCCNGYCYVGMCVPKLPGPPTCQASGWCTVPADCCNSGSCIGNICFNPVACTSPSNKLCDQCVAQSCCTQLSTCLSDSTCDAWYACIAKCEEQGNSAFTCAQSVCGPSSTPSEAALYSCAEQSCTTPCTTD